jgi:hypothetical protein
MASLCPTVSENIYHLVRIFIIDISRLQLQFFCYFTVISNILSMQMHHNNEVWKKKNEKKSLGKLQRGKFHSWQHPTKIFKLQNYGLNKTL